MSASNEWDEYHLTPKGWVRGTEKLDFGPLKEVPPPPDRYVTVREHEYQSSSFSAPDLYAEVVWEHPDKEMVSALRNEHGMNPNPKRYPMRR
jgi:hypothetical protein